MSRPPSERELLAEFVASIESEECEQELSGLLLVHGARVAPLLGLTLPELEVVSRLSPEPRASRVRQLLAMARQRSTAARAEQLKNLTGAAATMLAGLARFREDSVELDSRIVLGNLLADGSVKFLRFDVDGYEPVAVTRNKLRDAARALKGRMLGCFVDERGLTFTWREGIGRLTLYRQVVQRHEQERVFHVVVPRPVPATAVIARAAPAARSFRPAALFGEVLADIGFFA